jgi:hypothetical protein
MVRRMNARLLLSVTILALGAAPAAADPDGGTVSGTLRLASPELRGEGPPRGRGFLERMRNPLKAPEPFNPLPEIVVVLEGGVVHPDDRKPPTRTVRYRLVGESFESPVLPVVLGSKIEVFNQGRRWPRLTSPTIEGLLESEPPLPHNDRRRFSKQIETPYRAVVIRDLDAPHLVGRVVAVPHAYFSLVDAAGRFEIAGVPAGRWTVRIWYRDGFVEMADSHVDVKPKSTAKTSIELPARPKVAVPGEEG